MTCTPGGGPPHPCTPKASHYLERGSGDPPEVNVGPPATLAYQLAGATLAHRATFVHQATLAHQPSGGHLSPRDDRDFHRATFAHRATLAHQLAGATLAHEPSAGPPVTSAPNTKPYKESPLAGAPLARESRGGYHTPAYPEQPTYGLLQDYKGKKRKGA